MINYKRLIQCRLSARAGKIADYDCQPNTKTPKLLFNRFSLFFFKRYDDFNDKSRRNLDAVITYLLVSDTLSELSARNNILPASFNWDIIQCIYLSLGTTKIKALMGIGLLNLRMEILNSFMELFNFREHGLSRQECTAE